MTWDRVVDFGEIMNHKIGTNISVNMFHLRKGTCSSKICILVLIVIIEVKSECEVGGMDIVASVG